MTRAEQNAKDQEQITWLEQMGTVHQLICQGRTVEQVSAEIGIDSAYVSLMISELVSIRKLYPLGDSWTERRPVKKLKDNRASQQQQRLRCLPKNWKKAIGNQ